MQESETVSRITNGITVTKSSSPNDISQPSTMLNGSLQHDKSTSMSPTDRLNSPFVNSSVSRLNRVDSGHISDNEKMDVDSISPS